MPELGNECQRGPALACVDIVHLCLRAGFFGFFIQHEAFIISLQLSHT